tara:strand:+ start:49 stop:474 length:426 start_codon:yes stop_codon:yes gene_type:complete
MKTEGFVKLLRKVIREEVSKAIKAELRPLLNEVSSNNKTTRVPKKSVVQKKYTKNSMLNDLLNETAAAPAEQGLADYNAAEFRSGMAEQFGMEQHAAPLVTNDVNGAPINMANENVAATVGAMTRDYSALMKAIDKKKGIR